MTDPAHFSLNEVLEMALGIEANGKVFYEAAAKAATTDDFKKLFSFLALEEVQHTEFFEALITSIGADEHFNPTDPYFEEAGLYIKALADSSVFTEADVGENFAAIVSDERGALDKALLMEKESILFYHELKHMVREKDHSLMDTIIAEERKHVSMLTEVKGKLST